MSIYSGPEIITDGLVLSLDAANPKSYPGTGNTWYDLSLNKHTPTITGLTYTTANSGSMNMPLGSELFTVVPNSSLAQIFASGDFSIETVVRSTNGVYPRSRHPIYVNDTVTGASVKGWSAGHGATATQIELRVCDGTNLANKFIAHTVQESTVYHRVFTISRAAGALTKYYVNGALIGDFDAPSVTGTIYSGNNLVFGNVWGWRYIGDIFSIRIYNKVLTSNEIKKSFNATRGRFGI